MPRTTHAIRRCTLAALGMAAFAALQPAAAQAPRPVPEPAYEPELPLSSPAVKGEVEAVVRRFSDMYHDMYAKPGSDNPLSLFDRDEPAPQYLAEEMPDWFLGWQKLDWYFNDPFRNSFVRGQAMIPSNIRVRSLAPDLALATWHIHADMQFRNGPALGEKLRAQAILRRTKAGWRFIYYAESPIATMAYVRQLYEGRARPEFREEMARQSAAKPAAAAPAQ